MTGVADQAGTCECARRVRLLSARTRAAEFAIQSLKGQILGLQRFGFDGSVRAKTCRLP